MTGARAFLKKEFREIGKTYKIYVIPIIFLVLGLMSPIIAKIAPDLVKSVAGSGSGVVIQLPPPTAVDAYLQLFKNFNQIGVLVVLITSIGLVVEEKNRGTAILILAKPVPRWSFIISKYLTSAVLVVVSTLLSYFACLYYCGILFDETLFMPSFQGLVLLLVYYLLVLAITLFASTISGTSVVSGGIAIGGVLLLSLLPSLHQWFARYSPGALSGMENKLAAGSIVFSDAVPALIVTAVLAVLHVTAAVVVFQRQEL
jgi:ABC-2 type transport system permease protein